MEPVLFNCVLEKVALIWEEAVRKARRNHNWQGPTLKIFVKFFAFDLDIAVLSETTEKATNI